MPTLSPLTCANKPTNCCLTESACAESADCRTKRSSTLIQSSGSTSRGESGLTACASTTTTHIFPPDLCPVLTRA